MTEPRRAAVIAGLSELGWGQRKFAERLSVTENAVSYWMTGQRKTPGYAVAYVELALKVRRFCRGV